jgi:hypothetical protein
MVRYKTYEGDTSTMRTAGPRESQGERAGELSLEGQGIVQEK